MKFQVRKVPWCNGVGAKWVVTQISETSFVKIGSTEESHLGISAYVEVEQAESFDEIEAMTSEALYYGMMVIKEHMRKAKLSWRNDMGQI